MLVFNNFMYDLFAFVAFIIIGVYLYLKYAFTHWKSLGIPYIEPEFPYGNGKETIKAIKPFSICLIEFYNQMKAKGNNLHMGTYFFNKATYIPISPELVKNIMAKDFQYFHDRGTYNNEEDDPLSAHLFSLNGQKWKNLRAKLTPTFTSGKLKKMFQTLVDCSYELRDCLNEPIRKDEPIDIKNILSKFTANVIGSCAFGIECNCFENPDTDFIRLGNKIFTASGMERIKLFFAMLFPDLAKKFKIKITNEEVDQFFRSLVKDTIEHREKHNISRNDFMQLLIQLKNKGILEDDDENKIKDEIGTTLTLDEISAQAFLFFIAGYETSSTTMTFCLFELARNQNVQNKLREEIVRVLKKHEGKITYDSLMEMHYMEHVIQESLRKYPPVMLLQRIVTKDYLIPETSITLKKGTSVIIPIFALHMDPEYYPDPDKFDPERFTEENKHTRPDFTYLPFGEGPRICIGLRFGMMQVKVGLCQLLLNYKFTVNSKTQLPLLFDAKSFVISAKNGIWLDAAKVN